MLTKPNSALSMNLNDLAGGGAGDVQSAISKVGIFKINEKVESQT